MKRLLAAALLLLCAVVGISSHALADQDRALPKFKYRALAWEGYGPSTANGSCTTCGIGTKRDTSFFNGAETTSHNDTTEAFSTEGFAFTQNLTPNTASGFIRVFLYQSPPGYAISVDSFFVAVDTAPTQQGPWITGTSVGGVACTTGDAAGSIMLLLDTDSNADAATASKLYGAPWARLRIKGDGNSAAKFPGAKVMIGYPSIKD